jgi:hypothetical protein
MANPNIVNVTTIYGKTAVLAVTTSAQTIVSNASGSGKIVKVNVLSLANIDGTTAVDATVDIYRSSVAYKLLSTVSVPSDSTLVAISKDTSIYLEEGDSLRVTASANSDLSAVCSYEEIS